MGRHAAFALAAGGAAVLLAAASACQAQQIDTAQALRTLRHFSATCEEIGRALWGQSLCGPVIMVHASTRFAVANIPDAEGAFRERDGAWFGELPAGLPTANTSLDWAGQRWAMVLLPLPASEFDRFSLLGHEAFHRIQPQLGLTAQDAPNAHLDEEQGRLWLRMELRALGAALRREGEEARAAVHDAVHFRSHRQRLFPGADTLEALLERHEGLAEYTGVRYAMSALEAGPERAVESIERFERRSSFVRSIGYGTGPALGLLLDRYAPEWRQHAGAAPLAELLARAVGFGQPLQPADLAARAERYGYVEVAAEEAERAAAAAAAMADIHRRLLNGPALILLQTDLRASFNPNELIPVPGHGTYYPTATFQADWGTLHVTSGGALVAPDWGSVRVPAANVTPGSGGRTMSGEGWVLDLAPGWVLHASGADWRLAREKQ